MNTVKKILLNKKIGIDCSEEESAEIKGYFREFNGNELSKELAFFFPIEYAEFLQETETN